MDTNKFKHVIFEKNLLVKESDSKFFKRIIVGLIRYISDNKNLIHVPDEYFEEVPSNLGFKTSVYSDTDVSGRSAEIRVLSLNNDWVCGIDDDGGTEENINDVYFYAVDDEPKNSLRLVVNNTSNKND